MPTTTTLRLPSRYNGPPTSANGGFACGSIAAHVPAPVAEVRLRQPPPLDTDLGVEVDGDGRVTVAGPDGATIATAAPAAPLDGVEPPVRPAPGEARAAMRRHFGLGIRHLLSDCWVCGPERHDGLGLHFGPLPGHEGINAGAVVTDATLPNHDGVLAPEVVWAALDCPSYVPRGLPEGEIALLAGMTAELLEPVPCGTTIVAVGWQLGTDGRKHSTASALLDAGGRLLARARCLWIALR